MRSVFILLILATPVAAQEVTGNLRGGVYSDSDATQIVRSAAAVAAKLGLWQLSAHESVDIVSSASIDVRTSPTVDATSSASKIEMSDRRFETTVGLSHDDGRGHVLGVNLVHAIEADYQSVGAGLSVSWDVAERNTTLLASVAANHNWVTSILDPSFSETLGTLGFSAGVAQVVSKGAALRLHYDGSWLDGYQASPYRQVRFGDWTAHENRNGVLSFTNVSATRPETLPEDRFRHALVAEWVQALGARAGLETQARLARDTWGVESLTLGADLRLLLDPTVQLQLGYRFLLQRHADFFAGKYTGDPSSYEYYTSDKELGDERGHLGIVGLRFAPTRRLQLDARVDLFHYTYPGFALLDSRNSIQAEAGLRINF